MKHRSPNALILVVVLTTVVACNRQVSKVERPYESWVLRSVLDLKPRMLSIILDKNLWIAYNSQTGSLYKAWKGSINFDGPVYTSAHGPQPTSVGTAYMQEPDGNPWKISVDGGQPQSIDVNYKGHSIVNNKVTLTYELNYKGGKISVREMPEVIQLDSPSVGFERRFVTSGVPSGVQLVLDVHLSSLKKADDVETNGKLDVNTSLEKINEREFYKADGKLWLNSNDETVLTVTFTERPAAAVNPEKVAGEERIFEIMAKSDCNTCHNKEKKTIGPAYVDVAKRYQNYPQQVNALVEKVVKGGAGNWGDVAMTPHPGLSKEDAESMVRYIMSLDEEEEKADANNLLLIPSFVPTINQFDFTRKGNPEAMPGVAINVYSLEKPVVEFPDVTKLEPVFGLSANAIHSAEAIELPGTMMIQVAGTLKIDKETNVVFRLVSEARARLYLDDKLVVDNKKNDPLNSVDAEMLMKAGKHTLRMDYFLQRGGRFSLQWKPYGSEAFTVIPPSAYTYYASDIRMTPKAMDANTIPGDGIPLDAVHPSFDLAQARPKDFKPKVGGMDFLSDGRMVVSTWDSLGSVYILDDVQGKDAEAIKVKRIAYGLAEPLGLKVVNDTIYILQKQELTRLLDTNKDDVIDEYQTVCNEWKVSANFHEFAFGLIYSDGFFYGTLATAINPGGASTKPQIPDRGKIVKISKADGTYEFLASGLRTPNGIGYGVDHELFIADNQGDWLPASKIVHVQRDAWYGSRSVDFEGTEGKKETLPVVWLPQDEIGNSPSQPAVLNVGPYKNQMIHGEITHGGIKRVFAEKVNGHYQGAVFRFTQGLEVGINRLAWSPDGVLYAGGVGSTGNWNHTGKLHYGLQRLTFNNKVTFEMLAVRAKADGIEIEFTEPLKEGAGLSASDYTIRQWYYKPTADYGGPKLDDKVLPVKKVIVSDDRRKVRLQLNGMEENHLVYVRLNHKTITSTRDQKLWSTEAWYTMNSIPKGE